MEWLLAVYENFCLLKVFSYYLGRIGVCNEDMAGGDLSVDGLHKRFVGNFFLFDAHSQMCFNIRGIKKGTKDAQEVQPGGA